MLRPEIHRGITTKDEKGNELQRTHLIQLHDRVGYNCKAMQSFHLNNKDLNILILALQELRWKEITEDHM